MTHNLDATVFVYIHKETGQIKCEYLEKAKEFEDHTDWEHIATLEPRMWIEHNYAKTMKGKPEPKPDVIEYCHCRRDSLWLTSTHNLQLTFDGETGKLKSAEVLK